MQIDLNISPQEMTKLLSVAQCGEDILFVNNGEVVAQMNKVEPTLKVKRKAGLLQGRKLDSRFFEPLDKTELELW